MKWTTEKPTKAGYYWHRWKHSQKVTMDQVYDNGYLPGGYEEQWTEFSEDDGEWCGPIEEPE